VLSLPVLHAGDDLWALSVEDLQIKGNDISTTVLSLPVLHTGDDLWALSVEDLQIKGNDISTLRLGCTSKKITV
jgi:hypothetical protein